MDPVHPFFAPHPPDWAAALKDDARIRAHAEDLERIYTRLWQETRAVLGAAHADRLSIGAYARFMSALRSEEGTGAPRPRPPRST